jgi:ABC-type multidrug transport system permease subunit
LLTFSHCNSIGGAISSLKYDTDNTLHFTSIACPPTVADAAAAAEWADNDASTPTAESPYKLIFPLLFITVTYWLTNVRLDGATFLGFLVTQVLINLACESVGIFLGGVMTRVAQAVVVATIGMLSLMLVGGFYVKHLPSFVGWVRYLSPFNYALNALLTLEFGADRMFKCVDGLTIAKCYTYPTSSIFIATPYFPPTGPPIFPPFPPIPPFPINPSSPYTTSTNSSSTMVSGTDILAVLQSETVVLPLGVNWLILGIMFAAFHIATFTTIKLRSTKIRAMF